ncbi:MAG: hypothetical protein IT342_21705 [Candidatus Melainabacteria bacterium]|nr:hypothetical protein [Candidatus Melainabacteria bacterium]
MTEETHELAVIDLPILNPELIQPQDYLRPLIGATIYALVFTAPGTLIGLSMGFGITRLMNMQYGMVATVVGLLLISAMVHHFVWWRRLKNHGASAFIAYEDLEMPLEEAFELSLAATTQLPKSKIETFEDLKCIELRVKGNFWVTVDRMVEIKFVRLGESKTRVVVDSAFKLTRARTFLINKIWGPKWAPIVYRLDVNKNKQLLLQITDYLRRVPQWNHKYIYGDSFGGEKVA